MVTAADPVGSVANYSEGMFVGYRWFDRAGIAPRFAFGYGLSYSTFGLSGLSIETAGEPLVVRCTVANTGHVAGATVPQLYLQYPEAANEPLWQLRGFSKVFLTPGQRTEVTFPLPKRWLSIWDVDAGGWRTPAGRFRFFAGWSSRDPVLSGNFSRHDEAPTSSAASSR